jgi:hypothetical protein
MIGYLLSATTTPAARLSPAAEIPVRPNRTGRTLERNRSMLRRFVFSLALLGVSGLLAGLASEARAQTCDAAAAKKLKQLNRDAIDESDKMDYEKAKQKLDDAILVAQGRNCQSNAEHVNTYLLLGAMELRLQSWKAMEVAWFKALALDPSAELKNALDDNRRTPQMERLFAFTKAKAKSQPRPADPPRRATPPGDGAVTPPPDQGGPPKGMEHLPIDKWEEGKTLVVNVRVADELKAAKVSLFFRTAGSRSTKMVQLVKKGADQWTWSVSVPGSVVRGATFRYFLVAYAAGDQEVAASGNSMNMHLVTLTGAVIEPRRRGPDAENPDEPRRVEPRRVERRRADTEDMPDEVPRDRPRPRPRPKRGGSGTSRDGSHPFLFLSVGFGTGIGLMNGSTEITNEPVPGAPSLGSIYAQIEAGYLITQRLSINAFGRFGYLPISGKVRDPRGAGYTTDGNGNPVVAKGNDKDVMVLARVRYQSDKLLKAGLPINLQWYAGGGLGWGILRHLVNGKWPLDTSIRVIDTDRSAGFVPNAFGGVQLCVTRSCRINVFFELNYLMALDVNTDNNTYFHLDFTLGANFAF